MRTFSDEEIEVLTLIGVHGVEAPLSPCQREVKDRLENEDLIEGIGDEYDFDLRLTDEARLAIRMREPQWWKNERIRREKHIEALTKAIVGMPAAVEQQLDRLFKERLQIEAQIDQTIKSNEDELKRLQEKLTAMQTEHAEWLLENKDRFQE